MAEKRKHNPPSEARREFELDLTSPAELQRVWQSKTGRPILLVVDDLVCEDGIDLNRENKREIVNRLISFFQLEAAGKRSKL